MLWHVMQNEILGRADDYKDAGFLATPFSMMIQYASRMINGSRQWCIILISAVSMSDVVLCSYWNSQRNVYFLFMTSALAVRKVSDHEVMKYTYESWLRKQGKSLSAGFLILTLALHSFDQVKPPFCNRSFPCLSKCLFINSINPSIIFRISLTPFSV